MYSYRHVLASSALLNQAVTSVLVLMLCSSLDCVCDCSRYSSYLNSPLPHESRRRYASRDSPSCLVSFTPPHYNFADNPQRCSSFAPGSRRSCWACIPQCSSWHLL